MKKNNTYILINKINSSKGETLAEVLIAVLISAIGLLLLSAMIMSSTKLVDSGNAKVSQIHNGGSAIEQSAAIEAAGGTVPVGEIQGEAMADIQIKYGKDASAQINPAGSAVVVKKYKDTDSGLALYEKAVTP